MSTVAETLRAARALIDAPETWCQHRLWRDDRHCAFHAVISIPGDSELPLRALRRFSVVSLVEFNDTHTHAEVLALFDRAIAEAEAQP